MKNAWKCCHNEADMKNAWKCSHNEADMKTLNETFRLRL
ncbi:hypothetical protein F441_13689 [Phytophthora nicotianae CJ01A1]|uniref:Uncharacterized protein n=5 Tax=Phytophthora nicotianae TaxID=4792 RepID=W2R8C5_PHYN3|nr:hypothetical protein PPTG_21370 [Phytophthora nicotianae INRA-310]ETI40957.1 hypothetical protein F443_13763 [Phytophthora nicotianae P1569]ETK81026.1 hypothetical protein L915_13416 [Phytophthora nicotianae]ETP10715.1 hypothetical protein F441_13689 [Phytophthora nicotianae CJ01A1]ETL34452.1 hypothetical protein L916_13304 [Phytophthora nicotianae]ETN20765.1 hypothetical protein PPTG_21370 [Phytophthora nicotianae INRA-310]